MSVRVDKEQKQMVQARAGLESRILHGLACEWENARWLLDCYQRDLMRIPLFSLGDMQRRLGYWSSEKKEIRLSRNFVLNYPWAAVREVLRHEMAHQLADQVLGAANEPPHGPGFQKACRLLRADPKASGSFKSLRGQNRSERKDPNDKIMLRVKKLLALAESRNPHEAEAAMSKAHELIAKHNIELIAKDTRRAFVSVFIGLPVLRHYREAYHLASLLGEFYFVYGLWVSAYVLEKGKMGRVLEISGTGPNIKMACYVHDFVQRFIDTQWLEYNVQKGLNRHRKTDFAVGIIEGFRSKLKTAVKSYPNPGQSRSLVRMEDPFLRKYLDYKYPHTTRFRRKVSSQNEQVLRDGICKGRRLVISKGITARSEKSGKLIEDLKHERKRR